MKTETTNQAIYEQGIPATTLDYNNSNQNAIKSNIQPTNKTTNMQQPTPQEVEGQKEKTNTYKKNASRKQKRRPRKLRDAFDDLEVLLSGIKDTRIGSVLRRSPELEKQKTTPRTAPEHDLVETPLVEEFLSDSESVSHQSQLSHSSEIEDTSEEIRISENEKYQDLSLPSLENPVQSTFGPKLGESSQSGQDVVYSTKTESSMCSLEARMLENQLKSENMGKSNTSRGNKESVAGFSRLLRQSSSEIRSKDENFTIFSSILNIESWDMTSSFFQEKSQHRTRTFRSK